VWVSVTQNVCVCMCACEAPSLLTLVCIWRPLTIYMWVYIYVYVCMCLWETEYLLLKMCVFVSAASVCVCVCRTSLLKMCVYKCACEAPMLLTYICIWRPLAIYVCIYIYIYIYMLVCLCVCVCESLLLKKCDMTQSCVWHDSDSSWDTTHLYDELSTKTIFMMSGPQLIIKMSWLVIKMRWLPIGYPMCCGQLIIKTRMSWLIMGYPMLIDRNPPPREVFLFAMFPHKELCDRGPPSKNLYQVRRGGSSYSRFLMREHSN